MNLGIAEAFDLALTRFETGALKEAKLICEKIIETDQNSAGAFNLLGLIALDNQQFSQAHALFSRAIMINPNVPDYYNNLGSLYHDQNQHGEAEHHYRKALEVNPNHPEILTNLGDVLLHLNKHLEAVSVLNRALDISANNAFALTALGDIHQAQQKFDEARSFYEQALKSDPVNIKALNNLGTCLEQRGELKTSTACFRKAIELNPRDATALNNLGNILQKEGRINECIDCYQRALAIEPDFAPAYHNLGLALAEIRETESAIGYLRKAIAMKSDYVEAYFSLGDLLAEQGDVSEAAGIFMAGLKVNAIVARKQTAQLKPQNATSYYYLGAMYINLRQYGEAELCLKQSIALEYLIPDQYANLARALHFQGKADEALPYYRLMVDINPSTAQSWVNLGVLLAELVELEEARCCFIKALDLAPQNKEAKFYLALVLLKQGEFQSGWEAYESRRALEGFRPNMERVSSLRCPEWRGQPLSGRSLLICAEQGLGDSLQFFRYIQAIEEFGGYITFVCPNPLVRILRANTTANVIEQVPSDATYDYYCFLMSLPFLLDTRLDSIPAKVPYLYAKRALTQEWQTKLGGDGKLKVGLVWAGKCRESIFLALADSRRSIHFSEFGRLLDASGAQFYSLQKGEAATQALEAIEDGRLTDWTEHLDDFADTAALIANLDIVISVDTSVAHLSAAMGKPTWILSRFDGCWRWLQNRDDSPWYPSVRLFRQSQRGDWNEAIASVAAALTLFEEAANSPNTCQVQFSQ